MVDKKVRSEASYITKAVTVWACVAMLVYLLYFYLLGWNLYHDKPLSVVYGLIMGMGVLAVLAVGAYLMYTYQAQKHTGRAVRFDFLLLVSWVLLIATFFSYLSSAVYKSGFSDIVTLAAIVMIAPIAVVVLPKSSKIISLLFGLVALTVVTLEGTMIAAVTTASGDNIWTVALPIFLGLLSNIFAAVVLLSRFYTALQAHKK